ncbi:hypothetical protein [Mycobacterium colombiense]|uniref:hypothetical protein n=1 Tax=Mycobacterium colombiense TaxID=339268 RepID=UPI001F0B8554|nr:hypothetical protein [Mycobacterium colombiense]
MTARCVPSDTTETVIASVGDSEIGRKLVARPQAHRETAGLKEDRFLHFLTAPAEAFIEAVGAIQIGNAEGDHTQPLLHAHAASVARVHTVT